MVPWSTSVHHDGVRDKHAVLYFIFTVYKSKVCKRRMGKEGVTVADMGMMRSFC